MTTTSQYLRSGFTTGACAAAAAKGAALMLARQEILQDVCVDLPAGFSATFQLHGHSFSQTSATCFVVKDAGDDPDVTNGAEVWATVSTTPPPLTGGGRGVGEVATSRSNGAPLPSLTLPRQGGWDIFISGGVGIGKVTKPGLAVPPGEWAINPVPRRMIVEAVAGVLPEFTIHYSPFTFQVVISIPDGEERAKKTLNQRLGIISGLSILGTTGIVRPVSAQAWTDTIDAALDVAKACGCENVVLSTGRTSELAALNFLRGKGQGARLEPDYYYSGLTLDPCPLTLPEEAFIMMGDHIAHTLRACVQRGFMKPIVACQFAKLLKIACRHENTHAAASELDLAALRIWVEDAGLSSDIITVINQANTAREIAITCRFDPALVDLVSMRAEQAASGHASGIAVRFLVCGYDGNIVRSG